MTFAAMYMCMSKELVEYFSAKQVFQEKFNGIEIFQGNTSSSNNFCGKQAARLAAVLLISLPD